MGPKTPVSDPLATRSERERAWAGFWLRRARVNTSQLAWAHGQWALAGQSVESDSHRPHHDAQIRERLRGLVRGNVRRAVVGQLGTTPPTCMGAPQCRALPPGQAGRVGKRLERRPGRTEGVVTSGIDEKLPYDHQTPQ
jgi:hypothetical protein